MVWDDLGKNKRMKRKEAEKVKKKGRIRALVIDQKVSSKGLVRKKERK